MQDGRAATGRVRAGVGRLAAAERGEAVRVLARAFRDNPLNVAVIRSDDPQRRLRCNVHGARSLLPTAERHGSVLAARAGGVVVGLLIAVPPFGYPLPAPPVLRRLRALLGQGLAVAQRWGEVFEALDVLHPREVHAYLGTLGVAPGWQGRGVGAALLDAWLDGVDAEGLPAYLETDRERNVAFYRRGGFEAAGETEVLGVRVWRMWRPPRAAPGRDR